ncbi:sugar ABC transporter ATP-binding protein [Celeribacter sp.]|uniref:sugar ABC transporter ATP-binding protein n=1 Tax=Celeribacter sp. TaxID=1890673 RepID=UPI003A949906
MTVNLIEATLVAKSFDGVPALKNGALTLAPGEVHALCGGNGAGKSTFLNILMGLLERDSGSILIRGKETNFRNPSEALAQRIAIITQELDPIVDMTVAENIYLGREPQRFGVVDHRTMRQNAQDLLNDLRFDVDASAKMARLSLAQVQLVEIAHAISQNAEILIMDEPTSAIGEQETHVLFDAIRKLTTQGVGVIYVSHRLEELFEIADTYTVFRDGQFIESGKIADIDRAYLVHQIVGHEIEDRSESTDRAFGSDILTVDRLSGATGFKDISLNIKQGEIVGLYGLMGSGRSEFLNALFGIEDRDGGSVTFKDVPLPARRPDVSIERGMALVTEDRKDTGLVLGAPIRHNISLSILRKLSRLRVVQAGAEASHSDAMMKRLNVKAASDKMPVGALSGGNQQKVVIARCLSSEPSLLICDEPTRGIDEGAKQEIYRLLEDFTSSGGAVLVCSSEAPELLSLAQRIVIFKHGRIAGELDAKEASQKAMLHAAS